MILKYAMAALAITTVVSGGYAWYADRKLGKQADRIEMLESKLANCLARVKNIEEDARDDATVDDPGLYNVPSQWMLPEGPGTGGN